MHIAYAMSGAVKKNYNIYIIQVNSNALKIQTQHKESMNVEIESAQVHGSMKTIYNAQVKLG